MYAAPATSAIVIALSGDPLTWNLPSTSSMSSGAASSSAAQMRLALSCTLFAARAIASPPTDSDRDPYVPQPHGPVPVSPCTTSTFCTSMPSRSAAICA
jgi:hypothetical protein